MDAQEYIDRIASRRGAVSEFHAVLAKQDFDVLQATDELTRATVLTQRTLDPRSKELLFIVSLVALRGSPEDIRMHLRLALGMGIEPLEILEALEILIPLGGVILFKEALTRWHEVTGADSVRPSEDALTQSQAR
ncbi:MAG: carboxymuconolactone decarboxylase family protein [Actinobacteria bacterium]|nr:carboxymuconolactone decarboxylase family protein [Actinomycetota bacterium]